jgi:O-antigen/teichoic acid export membrane protein
MAENIFSNILLKVKKKINGDKDFNEIAKGGSTAFVVNLVGLGIGYLFVILVSRIYKESTAAIYGQYILVTLFLRIASIITRFGTDTTMLQLTAAFSTKKLWGNIFEVNRKLLQLLFFIGAGVTLLIIVLYKQWAFILKLPPEMILLSSLFVVPMALGLYYSQSLRGLKKIGSSTFLRSSALPVLNFLLLPVFLLFIGKSSPVFTSLPTYTFFLSIIITAIIGFIYWRKAASSNDDDKSLYEDAQYKSLNQLLGLSYPLLLAESMIFIGTWIDQLLLGVMGNATDVGIFNVCMKYTMLTSLSLQAINTISAPKFSEYYFKKDYIGLAKTVQKSTKIIFWTTVPVVVIFFLFPKFLLGVFGTSFTPGWIAFIILNISGLVNVMTGSVGVLLQMTGYQKLMQNILLVSIVLEFLLNIILIPIYGVTGAAIASTICAMIKNFGMSAYVKKYFKFNSIYFFGL